MNPITRKIKHYRKKSFVHPDRAWLKLSNGGTGLKFHGLHYEASRYGRTRTEIRNADDRRIESLYEFSN
jgi:hypothetical protein